MSLILDLIFPKTCLQCHHGHQYICSTCLSLQKTNPIKYFNQIPKEGSLSLFRYQSVIKKAISDLKYQFVTDLINDLSDISSKLMVSKFPHLIDYWRQNNFVLIPIPLHHSRQNWRGFNQSSLLGQAITSNLNLSFSDQYLFRSKNTHIQSHIKDHSLRQKNLQNAFYCHQKIPQNIILFDDVATSFSTLNSAFNSLKPCGLDRCWYLTLAG